MNWFLILAILPFLVFLGLLLYKKATLLQSAIASLATFGLVAILGWQITNLAILISVTKGFWVAFDILIIIFGAIFYLEILLKNKIVENAGAYLESVSKDYRVQVIILAWFMENFIEGTAGFGTPTVIVAPLLVALGMSPILAVIISLLGNSASVVFGAAGTPIRVGFAGLEVGGVPMMASLINWVGLLVPVLMMWVVTRKQKEENKQFLEALPLAIFSGIAFVVPSTLIVMLGQEFPSILGSIIGLVLVIGVIKLNLISVKNERVLRETKKLERSMSLIRVILPYGILVGALIGGKVLLGSKFNPGWAFILAGVAMLPLVEKRDLKAFAINAVKRSIEPFLVILTMSTLVQLMINSGNNLTGLPSALEMIAKNFETALLPFLSPFIGAFGSFLTGSATISNIMFGSLLENASKNLGMDSGKILALELVGGAAGNMIALADMLAAETVVGLKHQEREILKGVFWPCLIYVTLAGIIGMMIRYNMTIKDEDLGMETIVASKMFTKVNNQKQICAMFSDKKKVVIAEDLFETKSLWLVNLEDGQKKKVALNRSGSMVKMWSKGESVVVVLANNNNNFAYEIDERGEVKNLEYINMETEIEKGLEENRFSKLIRIQEKGKVFDYQLTNPVNQQRAKNLGEDYQVNSDYSLTTVAYVGENELIELYGSELMVKLRARVIKTEINNYLRDQDKVNWKDLEIAIKRLEITDEAGAPVNDRITSIVISRGTTEIKRYDLKDLYYEVIVVGDKMYLIGESVKMVDLARL